MLGGTSLAPLGFRTTPVYDAAGQVIATEDALGNRTSTVFDGTGRVLATQDARGCRTSFVHDAAGQQVAVVDARGSINTTLYDGRGSVRAAQDPLGARTSFQYDPNGNLAQRTDARGRLTTYTADALGRTVGMLYTAGSRVTFTFDPAGQQFTMQDATGITTSTYDMAGRQASVAHPIGKILTYGYDGNGSRVLLTDPEGGLTSYAYDGNHRLVGIVNPFGERTTITHDALDREYRKTLANGLQHEHTYDSGGRETVRRAVSADGSAVLAFTSTYDSVGNRLTSEELDGVRVTYGYDPSYQLVNEQRSGAKAYNTTYVYDQVGNRLQVVDSGAITTFAYNSADEQILITPPSGQPTTITYDENGNTLVENVGGQLTTNTWDDENKLVGISNPDGKVNTFAYAADGLRRKKETPEGVRHFVLDGVTVLQEVDAALARVAQYTDFPGYWGGLVSQRRDSSSRFYGFDAQGSTRVLTAADGSVTAAQAYKAFGEELLEFADVGGAYSLLMLSQGGQALSPYWYEGQFRYYRDAADRHNVGHRVLRPDWGRWLSRDPLVVGGGGGYQDTRFGDARWYLYVANMPTRMIDPLGLQHAPGGPWHPPEEVPLHCYEHDSCSTLSMKINYLGHTIESHVAWDVAHPCCKYPLGRHHDELVTFTNALNRCRWIAWNRCGGRLRRHPVPVPVPVPVPGSKCSPAPAPVPAPGPQPQRCQPITVSVPPWVWWAIGATVIIGGIAYVVVAGGAGAYVLVAAACGL